MTRRETGLYHGTRAAFRGPGGLVLPGDEFGKDNHRLGRSDRVYVTPDLDLAKAYALGAKGRGRARVLEVTPMSPLTVDDSTVDGDEQETYATDAARVLRVVWTEPK
jgi:hypothetical protein